MEAHKESGTEAIGVGGAFKDRELLVSGPREPHFNVGLFEDFLGFTSHGEGDVFFTDRTAKEGGAFVKSPVSRIQNDDRPRRVRGDARSDEEGERNGE